MERLVSAHILAVQRKREGWHAVADFLRTPADRMGAALLWWAASWTQVQHPYPTKVRFTWRWHL